MRRMLAALAILALATPVLAQDFPTRQVRLVVGFTPGGGADTTARIFAEKLSEIWKQPVVVENRPGAGGVIAATEVAKAAPDGYTLLVPSNTNVISEVMNPAVKTDFTRDFTPIAMVTNAPMVIAVNAEQVSAKNLREFTDMLKSSPGKYSYSACNMASTPHLAMEMYKQAMAIDAVHVAHKGCGPSVSDTVAGHIPIVVTVLPPTLAFIKQGKLRPIAVLDAERSPSAPDIPTVRESGIPELKDVSLQSYYGFVGPAGMPPALARKIEADVLRVAAMPDVRKRLEGAGMDMYVLDSQKMGALVKTDIDKIRQVVKAGNIKPE